MNVLTALSILSLGVLTVWFVWPLIADPILRKRAENTGSNADNLGEELFQSLAEHTGPKGHLMRVERG